MIRRRTLRRRDRLTSDERMDLKYGAYRGAFSSDGERRDAWERHRQELCNLRPGRRPQAFWDYDGPPELREPRDCTELAAARLTEPWTLAYMEPVVGQSDLADRRTAWLLGEGREHLRPGEREALRPRPRRQTA